MMNTFFLFCASLSVLLLTLLILCCLVRAVKGPRITDRILAGNMVGTMTIGIIAILGVLMDQSWLFDICLIYAMISFLAVVVLHRIYTGVYRQSLRAGRRKRTDGRFVPATDASESAAPTLASGKEGDAK
jgi:multicomponent Na+:H+ antiporter subunit F